MTDAAAYIVAVRSRLIAHPNIVKIDIRREEVQGYLGLFRYRLLLKNGDMLEAFERFEIENKMVHVGKYSFQWQNATGELKYRWDNAPHHPEIETHPHHLHTGAGEIQPHAPVTILDILEKLHDDIF